MKELKQEQKDLIKKPLPPEAVKPHPTKTYLSSIKAIYVTERLNDVFWVWSWQLKTQLETNAWKGMIVVKVTMEIPEYWIYYESFGWNDNGWDTSKNFDLWDAYKWATTDAITKICSYIWIWIDVFKWKKDTTTAPNKNENTEKKWYNDVDKNIDKWTDMVSDWETTPQAIISKIESQGFTINKANKEKILNLQ